METTPTSESLVTKYNKWTLPGGTNYNELLFTLPEKSKTNLIWKQNKKGLWAYFQDDSQVSGAFKENTEENKQTAASMIDNKSVESVKGNFSTRHWSEPNIVAHTRIDDRIIPSPNADKFNKDYQNWIDGNKKGKQPHPKDYGKDQRILFIEEIQSDWVLEGRRQGFKNDKRLDEIAEKLLNIIRKHKIELDDFEAKDELISNNTDGYGDLIEEYDRLRMTRIPDMPFKNNWHEFVLKNLLRKATEEGYS